MGLKITFLIENTVYFGGLKAEHGLAVLVELPEEKLLFDCGQSELLLDNAKKLDIDLRDITKIILSHGHYDHTGGLLSVLKYNGKKIDVYAHPDIFKKRYAVINEPAGNVVDGKKYIGIPESRKTYEQYGAVFNLNSSIIHLNKNTVLSGFVPRENDLEEIGDEFVRKISDDESDNCLIHDKIEDDNAAIFDGEDGLVIISGCAHSGIINIINKALSLSKNKKIKAVIGGFHLNFRTEEYTDRIVAELKKYDIGLIIPVHCTGPDAASKLKKAFREKCIFGSVGKSLKI